MRNGARFAVALVVGLAAPYAAQAKDVCVEQGTERLVFKKVKALKKPGTVVPLHGIYIDNGSIGAMSGTAFVRSAGDVVFGVTVHGNYTAPTSLGTDIHITMIGGSDFSATGYYTSLPAGGYSSNGWAPIDCKDVVLP
jgi:hypothetical protein